MMTSLSYPWLVVVGASEWLMVVVGVMHLAEGAEVLLDGLGFLNTGLTSSLPLLLGLFVEVIIISV